MAIPAAIINGMMVNLVDHFVYKKMTNLEESG